MIVFMIALFSASMVTASEINLEDTMHNQITAQLSIIISMDYRQFVIEEGKEPKPAQKFTSVQEVQDEIISVNKGFLPISDQVKLKIVKALSTYFDDVADARDFFNEFAQTHNIHEVSKEKTLDLLATHYENMYVRENFFGTYSLERLLDAASKSSKYYADRIK